MKKKIWIALFLALTLILILSGCNGNGLPKTAKINITFDPNPVPYVTEIESWPFNLILTESNGIGVTLISIRVDYYDQAEELITTQIVDEEVITDWFESNYIPAFSSVSDWLEIKSAEIKYNILTVAGVDDNDNPIEATGRVDFLPE